MFSKEMRTNKIKNEIRKWEKTKTKDLKYESKKLHI